MYRVFKQTVLATGICLVGACGGGGGGSGSPASTLTISGTAAAGAPVIGQVTVKDADGTLRSQDIRSDGSYSVDVTGLKAPFVFRAHGVVGGREVTLVSPATADDIQHTINITPFTDLMIANIAGQAAGKYFDSPDFAKLSPAALNNAKTLLTQRLQPILTNLGVDSGFDLLRSAFSANHTGFDAVMDVLRVSVDESANQAVIKDFVNNTQISDDLASPTDATVIPTPATNLTGVVSDLQAIEARFSSLLGLFAGSVPSINNANLRALFAPDSAFLNAGLDWTGFATQNLLSPDLVGAKPLSVVIAERLDADTVRVVVTLARRNGNREDFDMVAKRIGGNWLLAGDQRWIDNSLTALNVRSISHTADPYGSKWLAQGTRFERKLELFVDYAPAEVNYVRITGPGFSAPVLMHRSTQWQGFVMLKSDGVTETGGTWISECGQPETAADEPCVNFAQVPLQAVYTYQLLDSNRSAIPGKADFTETLPAPPATNAEAATNATAWFGRVKSISPAGYGSLVNNGNIHIDLIMPTDGRYVYDEVSYNGNGTWMSADHLAADGHSVDLTWSGAVPASVPEVSFWTRDQVTDRHFITLGAHNTP